MRWLSPKLKQVPCLGGLEVIITEITSHDAQPIRPIINPRGPLLVPLTKKLFFNTGNFLFPITFFGRKLLNDRLSYRIN